MFYNIFISYFEGYDNTKMFKPHSAVLPLFKLRNISFALMQILFMNFDQQK